MSTVCSIFSFLLPFSAVHMKYSWSQLDFCILFEGVLESWGNLLLYLIEEECTSVVLKVKRLWEVLWFLIVDFSAPN